MTDEQLDSLEKEAQRLVLIYEGCHVPLFSFLQAIPSLIAEVRRLQSRVDKQRQEIRQLVQQIEGHCDRIAQQSELLSKKAEK